MAVPTLAALRTLALAWTREPGPKSLGVLQARIAGAFSNELRARVATIAIEERTPGVFSLVARLERDGVVVRSLDWTPSSDMRQDFLADVFDPSIGMTHRRRRELDAQQTPTEPEPEV